MFLLRIFAEPTKFVISFCLSFLSLPVFHFLSFNQYGALLFVPSSIFISVLLVFCVGCIFILPFRFFLFLCLPLDVYSSVILSFFISLANSALDFKICIYRPLPCPSSSSQLSCHLTLCNPCR